MTSGPFYCWYFLLLKLRIFLCYLGFQVMAILCCVAKNSPRGTGVNPNRGGCERIMASRSSKSLPLRNSIRQISRKAAIWASREDASSGREMLSWQTFQQQYKFFNSEKSYADIKYSCEVIGSICHQDVSWMIRLEAEESPWPTV